MYIVLVKETALQCASIEPEVYLIEGMNAIIANHVHVDLTSSPHLHERQKQVLSSIAFSLFSFFF